MTKILGRDPARRCLPLHEWPTGDRVVWQRALVGGDPFEEQGSRSRFSEFSNRKVAKGYGRWLAFLKMQGTLSDVPAPVSRITPDCATTYVEYLELINGGYTVLARLQELHDFATAIDQTGDWSFLRRLSSRVRATTRPVRNKRTKVVDSLVLFELGCSMMANAGGAPTELRAAMNFRDGLLIAMLAARPLRLRNAAALVVGETLERDGAEWWIRIPGSATKTGNPIEVPWPDALAQPLDTYLAGWRQQLVSRRGRWGRDIGGSLWVSSHGSPMGRQAIYDRVVGQTKALLGRAINPHLIRDCAATSVAIHDPQHIRIVASILGHRSSSTSDRFYNQASSLQAAAQYQKSVNLIRNAPREST